jgi:hypothetical protein
MNNNNNKVNITTKVFLNSMTKSSQMYGMTSEVGEEVIAKQLPAGAELRKIYVDTTKPLDTSFSKYGHIFYNVLTQDGKGRWTTSNNLKYWEQEGAFRKLLPRATPVYPFEPMMDDLQDVISHSLEIDGKKSKFEIRGRYFSHNGFSMYVELLSPDIRKVIHGSYVKDDVVQLGLVIRNGIQTGVSLGADFFTMRLKCMNGAVGRGENFGSISVRHVGDQAKMIDVFKEGIPVIINLGQKILDVYEMSTAFRFNEAMAKKIYKRTQMTEKYFPDYFGIDKDQKDPEKVVNITKQAKELSLWEVFNDMTQALTKSLNEPDTHIYHGKLKQKMHLGFGGFSKATRSLHKALIEIVSSKGRAEAA